MNEKLSALIDGEVSELEARQLIESLKRDPELRGAWERYHLIRAAATRQGVALSAGFSDRVAEQIALQTQARAPLRFWPLASGFAVAALIAGVALFATPVFRGSAPTPIAAIADNKSVTVASVDKPGSSAAATTATPQSGFNAYLVGHNSSAPGMLPYARVVTYDSDK